MSSGRRVVLKVLMVLGVGCSGSTSSSESATIGPTEGTTSAEATTATSAAETTSTTTASTTASSTTASTTTSTTNASTTDETTGGCVPGAPEEAPALPPFTDGDLLLAGWQPLPGGLHAWTHADPDVLYDASEGKWKMWFSSVRATTCDASLGDDPIAIYYAESVDGLAWAVAETPALDVGAAEGWDRDLVETPAVLEIPCAAPERRFALVYAGGRRDGEQIFGLPAWQLGLAFSADGRTFTRLPAAESPYLGDGPYAVDGLVLRARDAYPNLDGVAAGVAADPELVEVDGVFHLFWGGIAMAADLTTPLAPIAISHATSTDLVHWSPSNNPVLVNPAGAAGQPSAIVDGGTIRLWFSQDTDAEIQTVPSAVFPTLGFWSATTTDGERFTVSPDRVFTWDPGDPGADLGLLAGPAVMKAGGATVLVYGSFSTQDPPAGSCAIHRQQGFIPGVQRLNVAGL